MEDPKWKGAIRHILTLVGAVLVSLGKWEQEFLNEGIEIVMQLIGTVMVAISFGKSWNAPEKNKD